MYLVHSTSPCHYGNIVYTINIIDYINSSKTTTVLNKPLGTRFFLQPHWRLVLEIINYYYWWWRSYLRPLWAITVTSALIGLTLNISAVLEFFHDLASGRARLGCTRPAQAYDVCDIGGGVGRHLWMFSFEHDPLINVEGCPFILAGDLRGQYLPRHNSEAVNVAGAGDTLHVEYLTERGDQERGSLVKAYIGGGALQIDNAAGWSTLKNAK